LTFELNGGQWWHKIGDWEGVSEAVAHLARTKGCDAMPVGLPQVAAVLLAGGPNTDHTLYHPDGSRSWVGGAERAEQLLELTHRVHANAPQRAFWPGDNLVAPPKRPRQMPYKPYRS
jgi:hypothetical protein